MSRLHYNSPAAAAKMRALCVLQIIPAQLPLVRFDDCFITLCPHWPLTPAAPPTFTAPCVPEVRGLERAPLPTRAPSDTPRPTPRSTTGLPDLAEIFGISRLAYAASLALLLLIAYILLRTLRLRRRAALPRSPTKAAAAAALGRSPLSDAVCTFSPLCRTDSDLDSEPGSARFRQCSSATKSVASARSRMSTSTR